MRALIVSNPTAGRHAQGALREALARHFQKAGIVYEIVETQPAERVGERVRLRLRDGFDLVVAAGGDGTVSAVIDGLLEASVPLGIVPMGTGNLLARELDIPHEIEEAVAMLAGASRQQRIDVMRINDRSYVLNAGIGILAAVVGGTSRREKRIWGPLAYWGAAVRKTLGVKPRHILVVVDGQAQKHWAVDATVLNGGMLARIIYPNGPKIRLDDGHLDLWIMRMRTLLDYPRYLLSVFSGRPASSLAWHARAFRRVEIRCHHPMVVQADGDVIGTTPLTVDLLPGAVTVLVPTPLRNPGLSDQIS